MCNVTVEPHEIKKALNINFEPHEENFLSKISYISFVFPKYDNFYTV